MATTPKKAKSVAAAKAAASDATHLKHKRRFCREEGCNRIVKSQGLCQRHGAKVRQCMVEGCNKGAQGNFDKMCKSHFKQMKRQTTPLPKSAPEKPPPPPEGQSVYDEVLPKSIIFTTRRNAVMPLIAHLKAGFDSLKPPAWHRNEERRARGMYTIENPATQLEGWERELVWMEILVLTGAPGASFRHLARAWGRDKGFHMVLAQFICERQGDVQRKKRIAEKEEAAMKSRGPAKKRRRLTKSSQSDADMSADIWDESAYADTVTNEALAADIFDFSAQEFESATALQRWRQMGEAANSDTASAGSQRSAQAPSRQAILGDTNTKIMPRPSSHLNHLPHHQETIALLQAQASSHYNEHASALLHQQQLNEQVKYELGQVPYLHEAHGASHIQFNAVQAQLPTHLRHSNIDQRSDRQQQYSRIHLQQENQQVDVPLQEADQRQLIEPMQGQIFQQVPSPVNDPRPEHPEQNPETSALTELSQTHDEFSRHLQQH